MKLNYKWVRICNEVATMFYKISTPTFAEEFRNIIQDNPSLDGYLNRISSESQERVSPLTSAWKYMTLTYIFSTLLQPGCTVMWQPFRCESRCYFARISSSSCHLSSYILPSTFDSIYCLFVSL